MPDSKMLEVFRQSRTFQDKYTYFILAAAASAIAFAVNRTQEATVDYIMIPLGAAVLCWGFSFYFGCRHLRYVGSNLYANMGLLKVEKGIYPGVGTDAQRMQAAIEGIKIAMESNSNKANRLSIWQFRLLIAGALFYLSWHFIEMLFRTICF